VGLYQLAYWRENHDYVPAGFEVIFERSTIDARVEQIKRQMSAAGEYQSTDELLRLVGELARRDAIDSYERGPHSFSSSAWQVEPGPSGGSQLSGDGEVSIRLASIRLASIRLASIRLELIRWMSFWPVLFRAAAFPPMRVAIRGSSWTRQRDRCHR
jgi:hypothetical protein